jgi:hypothetical protein
MIHKREPLVKNIAANIGFVSKSTELENALGLFDSNRTAQEFYKGFLSLVFGYSSLENLDKLNGVVNYPAIDLGEKDKRIAFQITTKADADKINDTIERFNRYGLYKDYDRLVFIFIGKKQRSYTSSFNSEGHFSFDKEKDLWDDATLAKAVDLIEDEDILEAIEGYLTKKLEEYKTPERLYPYDIKQCIDFIERGLGDLLGNTHRGEERRLPSREDEDYIGEKNKLNKVSNEFFIQKIAGHLQYGLAIVAFLKDPINIDSKSKYYRVTECMQEHYTNNRTLYPSIEDFLFTMFARIPNDYDNSLNTQKVKILLHNMYFNCDFGDNPHA